MSAFPPPFPHRLGKCPPKHDPRTLQLARYVRALPAPPPAVDWSVGPGVGKYGMMLNDKLGCCCIAGVGHLIQTWTGTANPPARVLTDDEILAAYEQLGGYNPQDPNTDRGCVELSVMNAWRQKGIAGDQIVAFVYVNPKSITELQQAIALFGGVYTGIALPFASQQQEIWDVTAQSPHDFGTWGGHCVPLIGYHPAVQGNWFHRMLGHPVLAKAGATCITWGATKRMTWDFVTTYMDEAYAVVTRDWLAANGCSPTGFDINALLADLNALTSV